MEASLCLNSTMIPTHRLHRSGGSSSRLSECSICRLYGFQVNDGRGDSELPELQADPREPVFVNHVASLLSSIDVESLSEEAHERDSASRTEAILELKIVLSSILRSPCFSPVERANILRDTRATLSRAYHLPARAFDQILNGPFQSLDGLTPLEFEILQWSPIWQSFGDEGLHGASMAMIRFLIEHWKYSDIANESGDLAGSSNNDIMEPRSVLVGIVRKACLRRIGLAGSKSSESDEDAANILFQRIVGIIWSCNAGVENNNASGMDQGRGYVGASDFRVSVAYKPSRTENFIKRYPSALSGVHEDGDIEFNALIFIRNFSNQLNMHVGENTSAVTPSDDPTRLVWSSIRERITVIRNQQLPGLRRKPYARPIAAHRSQQDGPSAPTFTESLSKSVDPVMFTSSRLLLIDFISARRGWTLGIGRNELQLSVHGRELSDKLQSEPGLELGSVDTMSGSMSTVHAEVRLVPPHPARSCGDGPAFDDHVFTFSDIHIPSSTVPDKDVRRGDMQITRILPCFSTDQSTGIPQSDQKPLIARFDDPRLLNADELLLELRVRIQTFHIGASAAQSATLCSRSIKSQGSSTEDESSWRALSVPSQSKTSLGVASMDSSDLTSSYSCKSTHLMASSWTGI